MAAVPRPVRTATLTEQVYASVRAEILAGRARPGERLRLVADGYGGRQTLFELFNALPWTNQRDQLVMRYDVNPYKQLALATAGVGSPEAAAAR